MFSDPNIHFRTEVRSYAKNVPTVFFGGVEPREGLEIVPDILIQKFLEIRILTATGAGSDQPCSAGLGQAKIDDFVFSRIVKGGKRTCRGAAGEMSQALPLRRPVDRCEAVRPRDKPVLCGEAGERG